MKRIARFLSLAFVAMLIALPVHATVSSETTRVKYTCDGTTTVYAYPFKIYENDDILAVKAITSTGAETTLVLNTDYTVSGAGGTGGNVTLTAGSVCGSGSSLTILRNIELTQETDYVDGQAFSAESLENAIDKVTLIQQQQEEKIGRAPKLPKTSSITDIALPNPSANNYIGWNAGATNLENKASPVATTATQYEVDALISYGGGTAYTQATIASALTAIGTVNKTTLLLRPGTWVISSNADWSAYSNVMFRIVPGALLQIATGTTTTIASMDETGLYQRFSLVGTGTVRFRPGSVKEIVPQWFGASPSATAAVNSAAFQAALDSMGTYPPIPLYIPGASVGSVGNYQINVALTKTSADWIRIRGDGSSSWLEWTGADYATMLSLTGEGSGNASVDGVRFDCNNKATTGLALANFGHGISVTKSEFNDGLANVADNQGMLNIPLDGETHNGLIQRNYFGGGTAIGIGLGLTGASSASGGFDISVNEFQQVNNWAVKAGKIKESTLKTNVIDQILANVNGGGFYLDIASQIDIINNHMEPCAKEFIKLNPTARYDFKSTTSRILNNLFIGGPLGINLGYTDNVELNGNTSLAMSGQNWLTVTANAYGTTIGRNTYSSGVLGTMAWAEQYIGGAGIWNMRYGYTTVASTTAVLSLTNQSASAAWVELTPISTLTEPDIPSDVRAVIVQASIRSATAGARLYMVNEGNAPLWADRATDMRVQYIEAQAANRYNTATFTIPIKNTSYEDAIYYSIDPTGVNDTDVELRIVGYLMPM